MFLLYIYCFIILFVLWGGELRIGSFLSFLGEFCYAYVYLLIPCNEINSPCTPNFFHSPFIIIYMLDYKLCLYLLIVKYNLPIMCLALFPIMLGHYCVGGFCFSLLAAASILAGKFWRVVFAPQFSWL